MTEYTCSSGSCNNNTTTEDQSCSRDTDGDSCTGGNCQNGSCVVCQMGTQYIGALSYDSGPFSATHANDGYWYEYISVPSPTINGRTWTGAAVSWLAEATTPASYSVSLCTNKVYDVYAIGTSGEGGESYNVRMSFKLTTDPDFSNVIFRLGQTMRVALTDASGLTGLANLTIEMKNSTGLCTSASPECDRYFYGLEIVER